MFEPELFSALSTQYRDLALLLITPTLAFVFLYLLALPLKRLPFLDALDDYRPPTWVLPVFALSSTFLLVGCLGIYAVLSLKAVLPSPTVFLESYKKDYTISLPQEFRLQSAIVTIKDYDGFSDFQIFANGYRVFSSSYNCHLFYQCRLATEPNAAAFKKGFDDFQAKSAGGLALHQLNQQSSLPHQEDFSAFTVMGQNYLDINAENSGAQTCHLDVRLTLTGSLGESLDRHIIIVPHGNPVPDSSESTTIVFQSGAAFAADGYVPVYKTLPADQTLRLCERIRFSFPLDREQLPDLVRDCDSAIAQCRREAKASLEKCIEAQNACGRFRNWSNANLYAATVRPK